MLHSFRNFGIAALTAIIIFGMLAWPVVSIVSNMIPEPKTEYDSDGETVVSHEIIKPDDEIPRSTFNILLIGTDYQPKKIKGYHPTSEQLKNGIKPKMKTADTIILLRVDKENKRFIFCPIPSISVVSQAGENVVLGELYDSLGTKGIMDQVKNMTGLNAMKYAVVDVGNIAPIVDAVGGVDFYVSEDMQYVDKSQDLTINVTKGPHEVDGNTAEQILRYIGSDGLQGRLERGIKLLKAIFDKYTNISYIDKAGVLFDAFSKYVDTDFTLQDLTDNVQLLYSYSKFEIRSDTYPGEVRIADNKEYYVPDLKTGRAMFSAKQK